MLCKHAKVLVEVEPLDDVSAGTNTGGAFLPAHGAFSGISGLGLGRWPVHSINKCLDCTGHLTDSLVQVESVDEVSARTNTGRRCFQCMVLCNLWHFWHWPDGRHWLDGLLPNAVAQQVSVSFQACTVCPAMMFSHA